MRQCISMQIVTVKYIIKTADELTDEEFKQVVQALRYDTAWTNFFKPMKVTDTKFRETITQNNYKYKFDEDGQFLYICY